MANYKSDLLENWLGLLCRMIPGSSQAVLLPDPGEGEDSMIRWPAGCELCDETISTARLAASQKKKVTTTLSSAPGHDEAGEMVIALPLDKADSPRASLAVLVRIKPSQQSVVTQILHWGEDWLQLLLHGHRDGDRTSAEVPEKIAVKPARSARWRLAALGAVVLIGAAAFTPGSYRVTAAANIEGKVQRAVVAPFDGYIAAAHARAGETVAAGEVIAELDTEELQLQRQRHIAEKAEYDRQYRKALANRDQTQAHIFKSQMQQTEAQLDLVEKKIDRAGLRSTLDGVIITGDLSRSLGAPVATGEILFEVAPLDQYRLIVQVDEKQVAEVDSGMTGMLTLKALPGSKLPFSVQKVSPVYAEDVDGISYRVEARLDADHAALRPGMEGVAKIEIGQRSLLWIYTHELLDLIRLWAWRWLP